MKYLYLLLLFGIMSPLLLAQDEEGMEVLGDTLNTSVDLFEGDDPLVMTLTFDLKKYQREKYKEEYIPADLLLHVNDTFEVAKKVRIKSRGQFRQSHCSFAPFWLNIRKADVANEYLQEVVRMKIVTHCNGSSSYGNYVLTEYLAYRMYNILSPLSFRVRLIKMKYVDTGRKNRVTEGWSFMIEPESMLADRSGGMVTKNDQLGMIHARQDEMLLVSLFQYMIGNADYSVAGRHNIKLLGMPGFGSEGYTPVPYDFDYSGMVNAYYAEPGENLGISSVTQRYYLGPCAEDEPWLGTMQYMEEHREEIMDLLHSFPYLDKKEKNRVIAYIENYYISAAGPRFVKDKLENTCR